MHKFDNVNKEETHNKRYVYLLVISNLSLFNYMSIIKMIAILNTLSNEH